MVTDDITARFAEVTWMDANTTPVDDLLSVYVHWEPFNAEQTYSKRPYRAAYQGRFGWYHTGLCIVKTGSEEQYYIFARPIKTPLDDLIPFCPCLTCRASRVNPLKYVWCPQCTGCLKAGEGFARDEYRNQALLLQQMVHTPSKWDTYKKQILSVRVCELVCVGVCVLIAVLV